MSLLDKIRNVRHGICKRPRRIGDLFGRHQQPEIRQSVRRSKQTTNRGIYASSGAPASKFDLAPPRRRPGSPVACRRRRRCPERRPRAQDQAKPQRQASDATKDNQRKTDEFVEAAQAINGPAGNPECVWLGRRVVRLMWLDDLDTAFRHLDLYDRFGCPGGHVQATFRCLTRFGGQIDSKVPEPSIVAFMSAGSIPTQPRRLLRLPPPRQAAPPARPPVRQRPNSRLRYASPAGHSSGTGACWRPCRVSPSWPPSSDGGSCRQKFYRLEVWPSKRHGII